MRFLKSWAVCIIVLVIMALAVGLPFLIGSLFGVWYGVLAAGLEVTALAALFDATL